jgi:endonuclease/exonuclease/phosphatase family metal-dependent hydrolase
LPGSGRREPQPARDNGTVKIDHTPTTLTRAHVGCPFQVDHVLVSPRVEVQAIPKDLGQRSDHRPDIADLGLLP